MFARNWDLCWLATASWRPFSSTSRNSRAFWMASVDWVAKVFRSSTTSGANSPGVRRFTVSAPMTWSSRSSGTTSRARYPIRTRMSRKWL